MSLRTSGHSFLIALLAGAAFITAAIFRPFFAPLVLAAVFAVILHPVYKRIHREIPRWPSGAALLTVLFSVICILVPLGFIGTQIGFEAAALYSSLVGGEGQVQIRETIYLFENFIGTYVPEANGFSERISEHISTYAKIGLTWILQHLGGAFSGIASLFLSLFIFFIALYYLLRDGASIKRSIVEYSPLSDQYDESVIAKLELAVNSVVKGNLMIALIQGTLSGIGFAVFGVPNPILWGSVTALAALIPGLGTALIFTPAIIFLFITGNTFEGIGLLIWGALAVGLIDNMLGPRLIGEGMRLHPLLVLLSVLGGITFFGVLGIFIGPLALALLFSTLGIYRDITKE